MKQFDVGNRKQLFIDERFVQQKQGVGLTVNPPVKRERVIVPEKPWESVGLGYYGTVLEDEGIFKLWYEAYLGTAVYADVPVSVCYATSEDGLHWRRPRCPGAVRHDRSTGSRKDGWPMRITTILLLILTVCASAFGAGEPLTLRRQMGIQAFDTLQSPAFEPEFQLMQELGFRHARIHDSWEAIRPKRELSDNWASFDPMMANCRRFGIESMILLAYGNPWASTAPPETTDQWVQRTCPPDIAEYAAHARAWAQRYKDQPIAFEVWNEPNGSDLFWKGSAEAYAEMLRAAYVAIKGVDPTIPVSMAGPSGSDIAYIENVLLRLGADSYCDTVPVHPYGLRPEQFPILIGGMRDIADKCKFPKQIWFTEWGFLSEHHPDVSFEDQKQIADQYVRTTLLSLLHRVDRNYTFSLLRVPDLALVKVQDGKPVHQPAFEALKNMMDQVGDLPLMGTLRCEADLYALVFAEEMAGTYTIAYWTSGKERRVTLSDIDDALLFTNTPQYRSGQKLMESAIEPAKVVRHSIAAPIVPLEGWIEAPTHLETLVQGEGRQLRIRARLNNNLDRVVEGELRLQMPSTWKCEISSYKPSLQPYESRWFYFDVLPPNVMPAGLVKDLTLEGRIDSVAMPSRTVPLKVVEGLGITAAFEPVKLGDDGMNVTVRLENRRPGKLSYTVHPARGYLFPEMRGMVSKGREFNFPMRLLNRGRSDREPIFITLNDGKREQRISAKLDFPLAAQVDSVVVDGDLAEWDGVPCVRIDQPSNVSANMRSSWHGTADLSADIRCAFTAEGLCFAIQVRDDHVTPNRRGESAWNGDCIEIFLSPENRQKLQSPQPPRAPTDLQFLIPALPDATPADLTFIDVRFIGGQEEGLVANRTIAGGAATKLTKDGYATEVIIPWRSLPAVERAAGSTLGFDVAVDDDDSGIGRKLQMQWRSGINIHQSVAQYGTLLFVAQDQVNATPSSPLEYDLSVIPKILVGPSHVQGQHADVRTAAEPEKSARASANPPLLDVKVETKQIVELELFNESTSMPPPGYVPRQLFAEARINGKMSRLRVRLVDAQGEVFLTRNEPEITGGSDRVRHEIQLNFGLSWGGNDDREIDLPLRSLSVLLEPSDEGAATYAFSELSFDR